ncbi:chromosome segregation protein Spc25-domain-containing protein [Chlamydoabsidia padenii]|nr:chromosome segregation protein Spc25-domain-containing protein [Chlamydoabsidia padenii]
MTDHYRTLLTQKRKYIDDLTETIQAKRQAISEKKAEYEHLDSLYTEIQSLEQHIKTAQVKLDALREKQSLEEQEATNSQKTSEKLRQMHDILARKTGMRVHTIKENYLKFDFTLIDEKEPDKLFFFVLQLSQEKGYQVVECDPWIPTMDTLIKELNQNGNEFATFIRRVRQAFCDLVTSPPPTQHIPSMATLTIVDQNNQPSSPPSATSTSITDHDHLPPSPNTTTP